MPDIKFELGPNARWIGTLAIIIVVAVLITSGLVTKGSIKDALVIIGLIGAALVAPSPLIRTGPTPEKKETP